MLYGTYRTSKSACLSNWGNFQNILKDPMITRYGWKKKIQFKEIVEVGSASCLMLPKDGHILKFPWMKGEGSKWCRREQDKHATGPDHAGSRCVPRPALPSPLSLVLCQEESSLDLNKNFLLVLRECYQTRVSVFACFSQISPMSCYLWTHFSEHGPVRCGCLGGCTRGLLPGGLLPGTAKGTVAPFFFTQTHYLPPFPHVAPCIHDLVFSNLRLKDL